MARKKRMYVIFAAPEVRGGPGRRFFGTDGKETDSQLRAATFSTSESAMDFVRLNGIELDGAMRYIGRMDYDDPEIRRDSARSANELSH
jgi:hypothetical protein